MPVPTHTYGQSTVTAVQLVSTYPSDTLFPSDTAYPDTMYAPVSPLAATVTAVVPNGATVATAVTNDARLLATSFGGAALTPTAAQIQLT